MDKGTFVAFVAIIGYIAFEVYGVHTQKHLMQADYIHAQYAAAQRAMERCGEPTANQREQFNHNLAVMERRARQDLAEERPEASPAEIATVVEERAAERIAEVDALVESEGCDAGKLWTLQKTYEQRARLNLH